MPVNLYAANGKFYVGNEIFSPGVLSLLFNKDDTEAEIRSAIDSFEMKIKMAI